LRLLRLRLLLLRLRPRRRLPLCLQRHQRNQKY
jgi:hypothetical protein